MTTNKPRNHVKVHVLPTGYLWLPDRWIFSDGDDNLKHFSPDFSFLICHPSGRNVLFDLGLRKVWPKLQFLFDLQLRQANGVMIGP